MVLVELNKQIRDSRETGRKVKGGHDVSDHPDLLRRRGRHRHAVVRDSHLRRHVQGPGRRAAGHHPVRRDLSGYVVHYGLYVVVGLVAAVVVVRQYGKTESRPAPASSAWASALPLVGDLIVQSAMYRFASNIALLLKSGIPMLETLSVLEGVFQTSPVYRDALARVQTRVASGRPLAASLEETGLFTTMITNMVRIGEESGQLSLVMEQLAPYYKEKMETMIGRVTKLLEPLIIMGMGSTVAGTDAVDLLAHVRNGRKSTLVRDWGLGIGDSSCGLGTSDSPSGFCGIGRANRCSPIPIP